jgi:exopolysaccharide biosynthesis polyprenyl glycosylphosphotransferase
MRVVIEQMLRMSRTSVLSSFLGKEMYRKVVLKDKDKNFYRKKILVIGGGRSGRQLAETLNSDAPQINIIGFIDDEIPAGVEVISGKKIIGRIDDIKQIAYNNPLDEVFIAVDKIEYERLLELMEQFRGLDLQVNLYSERLNGSSFARFKINGVSILDVTPSGKSRLEMKIKRLIDITGSLVGLILLAPLFFLLVILIKVSSPGPILFRQTRIGLDGKPFTFYKFRSMHVMDGEDEERKQQMIEFMKKRRSDPNDTKVINDKRVTWVGKFIRRTSIDELPQLFNVLKGEMSLVGPRPCLPYEYENYTDWQKNRVKVLPGCTGVWQVSGRSMVSFDDSVLMDLYYINNMSLLFDFKILLRTIPVILFSKGGK